MTMTIATKDRGTEEPRRRCAKLRGAVDVSRSLSAARDDDLPSPAQRLVVDQRNEITTHRSLLPPLHSPRVAHGWKAATAPKLACKLREIEAGSDHPL